MDSNWNVTFRNRFGQPKTCRFESKEEFERFYSGKVNDGSGEPVRNAYPDILYQGEDQQVCQKVMNDCLEKTIKYQEQTRSPFGTEFSDLCDL